MRLETYSGVISNEFRVTYIETQSVNKLSSIGIMSGKEDKIDKYHPLNLVFLVQMKRMNYLGQ